MARVIPLCCLTKPDLALDFSINNIATKFGRNGHKELVDSDNCLSLTIRYDTN